jgi:hypothetical protein
MKATWQNIAARVILLSVGIVSHSFAAYHFTTLDDPLASGYGGTFANGIYEGNIVGNYIDTNRHSHGFLLSGTTYTTIDDPLASGTNFGTFANGIYAGRIVGCYYDGSGVAHGFLLSGTTYTTLDDPLASGSGSQPGTYAQGISGNTIVGFYSGTNGEFSGFSLTGTTYTTLDDPQALAFTQATGIYGSKIVGVSAGLGVKGFLLSGTTYTSLADPSASFITQATGIYGSNIVGFYYAHNTTFHGFVNNGKVYTALNDPLASGNGAGDGGTVANGIYQDTIVGSYIDKNGIWHGFLAIPNNTLYTLLLGATIAAPGIPQATGYATMTVTDKGGVILSGVLPDGEPFSTHGSLDLVNGFPAGTLSFAQPLRYPSVTNQGSAGFLYGSLSFAPVLGASDISGTLEWIKPQQSKGDYQAPFDTNLAVIGSFYAPPAAGGNVLPGFPIEGSGLSGGSLVMSDMFAVVLSGSAYLTTANQLLITNRTDNLKITITPSTGVFKGSFLYLGNVRVGFTGVLFQDQSMAGGLFLGPNGYGSVSLTP